MKNILLSIAALGLVAVSSGAAADPWKDESGHGRHGKHGQEYKEEYWDGNCKVERKVKKNGDTKVERKCKGPSRPVARHDHYDEPAVRERVYYPAYDNAPRRNPEVAIDVRIRQ